MDTDANKYLAALTAPFSRDALGAQVPDQYSFPTTTQFVKCNYTISADSNGCCDFTLMPSLYANLLFGVDSTGSSGSNQSNCGGVNVSDFNLVDVYSPDWFVAGVAQPAFVQNYYEQYRIVGWGARVMPLLAPLNQSGRLLFSSTPSGANSFPALSLGRVGALDNVDSLPAPLISYKDVLAWNQLPGTDIQGSGVLNILTTEIINVPSSIEFSYSKLSLEGGMEWVSKPTNAKVLEWRTATNDTVVANSSNFGSINLGSSATCTVENALTVDATSRGSPVLTATYALTGGINSAIPQIGDYIDSIVGSNSFVTVVRNYIVGVTPTSGISLVPRINSLVPTITLRVPKVKVSTVLGTPHFNYTDDVLTGLSGDFNTSVVTSLVPDTSFDIYCGDATVRPVRPGVTVSPPAFNMLSMTGIPAGVTTPNTYIFETNDGGPYPGDPYWDETVSSFPGPGMFLFGTAAEIYFPAGTYMVFARAFARYATEAGPYALYNQTFIVQLSAAPITTLFFPTQFQFWDRVVSEVNDVSSCVDTTVSALSTDNKVVVYPAGDGPALNTLFTYSSTEVFEVYLPSVASKVDVIAVDSFNPDLNPPIQFDTVDGSPDFDEIVIPNYVVPLVFDSVDVSKTGTITFASAVTIGGSNTVNFKRTSLVPSGVAFLPEYTNTGGWSNMSCRGVGLPPAVGDVQVPVLSVEVSFHLEGVSPVNRNSSGAFGYNASKPYSNKQFMDAAMDVATQQPMFRKFQESSANALAMLSMMS